MTLSVERLARQPRSSGPPDRGIMIQNLDLLRPIYRKTACYGHFGRNDPDFTWERTDRTEALRRALAIR